MPSDACRMQELLFLFLFTRAVRHEETLIVADNAPLF